MSSHEDLTDATANLAARRLSAFVEAVLAGLDLAADVEVAVSQEQLTAVIRGPDVDVLTGQRGATLDAIQYLAQRIVWPQREQAPRIVIDADDYRARRADALLGTAEEAAEEALRSNGAVVLEPMPASERRVIHEHLADRGDVRTHSEGDEPRRHLVVSPIE